MLCDFYTMFVKQLQNKLKPKSMEWCCMIFMYGIDGAIRYTVNKMRTLHQSMFCSIAFPLKNVIFPLARK